MGLAQRSYDCRGKGGGRGGGGRRTRYSRGVRTALVRITRKLKILRLCFEILFSLFLKNPVANFRDSVHFEIIDVIDIDNTQSYPISCRVNTLDMCICDTQRAISFSRGDIILINVNRISRIRRREIVRNKNIRRRIGRREPT